MPRIKNIHIIPDHNCSCGDWLKHWEKFSKRVAIFCSEESCVKTNVVGALVQKTTDEKSWFILPLCKTHEASKNELHVSPLTLFISADKRNTCGKKILANFFTTSNI